MRRVELYKNFKEIKNRLNFIIRDYKFESHEGGLALAGHSVHPPLIKNTSDEADKWNAANC